MVSALKLTMCRFNGVATKRQTEQLLYVSACLLIGMYVGCRDNDEDTQKMLDNLRSGRYKALLLDAPVLEYIAATNPLCDLYVVGDSFETFNLALEFPADFDDALIARMSAAILKFQVKGVQRELKAYMPAWLHPLIWAEELHGGMLQCKPKPTGVLAWKCFIRLWHVII